MKSSSAVVRAVEEAVGIPECEGVQVIPFDPPDVEKYWGLYFALFYADAFRYLKRHS